MAERDPRLDDPVIRTLAAELHALRERVQNQHALLDIYNRMHGKDARVRVVEIRDPLPPPREAAAQMNGAGAVVEHAPPGAGSDGDAPPAIVRRVPPGSSWWPREEPDAPALLPNVGWTLYSLASGATTVIGFSVCGLPAEAVEQSVELIAAVQRQKRSFSPLFLTDSADLAPFRSQGFSVEYLPAAPPAGVTEDGWKRYGADRRRFLIRKWNLSRIVDVGPRPFGGEAIQPDLDPDGADEAFAVFDALGAMGGSPRDVLSAPQTEPPQRN